MKNKIAYVDLTPTAPTYDKFLFQELKLIDDSINIFMAKKSCLFHINETPPIFLFSNPIKTNKLKRLKQYITALLYGINLTIITFYLLLSKYSTVHFQWLPSLKKNLFEMYFLKLLKLKKIKIIYTVHNIYPHDNSSFQKEEYKKRFNKIKKYIDIFICHTQSTKNNIIDNFQIEESKIQVIFHGIFHNLSQNKLIKKNRDFITFTHFGFLSPYKGTDLVIKAFNLLSQCNNNIRLCILGAINDNYKKSIEELINNNPLIEFTPSFIETNILHQKILESDILLFPYRQISQSGALLTALGYGKNIISSDLPSFKETLFNFDSSWFCKTDDYHSLYTTMNNFLIHDYINLSMQEKIKELQQKYDWKSIAKQTYDIYTR